LPVRDNYKEALLGVYESLDELSVGKKKRLENKRIGDTRLERFKNRKNLK